MVNSCKLIDSQTCQHKANSKSKVGHPFPTKMRQGSAIKFHYGSLQTVCLCLSKALPSKHEPCERCFKQIYYHQIVFIARSVLFQLLHLRSTQGTKNIVLFFKTYIIHTHWYDVAFINSRFCSRLCRSFLEWRSHIMYVLVIWMRWSPQSGLQAQYLDAPQGLE